MKILRKFFKKKKEVPIWYDSSESFRFSIMEILKTTPDKRDVYLW